MSEYELTSPFITLTFGERPRHFVAISAVWTIGWLIGSAALVYAYATVFAAAVGFETAVLVGIGIIALATGGVQ